MSEGKVSLVTGATRGIGYATVEALLARGRRVIACGRNLSTLAALCDAYPGRLLTVVVDLSEPGRAEWLVDEALRLVGMVNELVYSAGIVRYASMGKVSEADLRAQLEVNFIAPFLMSQRLGLHMRACGGGAIVHVASTLGLRPARATAAYAASKAALIQATRSLAIELAPEVRVNAVAPGVVDTDMIRAPRGDGSEAGASGVDTLLQSLAALHPLGRLGAPSEIAEAILFLLDASWMTGSTLTVDGGLLAG